MKFYFIYEQAFPLGFGLTAVLCTSLGIWGLATRRPLMFPFLISFICYLGVLVPLFLLSLNHFLAAWPLDVATSLLNGVGVVGCPALLLYLWLSRFEVTSIGVPVQVLDECLGSDSSCAGWRRGFLHFGHLPICYLKSSRETTMKPLSELRSAVSARVSQSAIAGPLFCLAVGLICAGVAGISWCTSARCLVF